MSEPVTAVERFKRWERQRTARKLYVAVAIVGVVSVALFARCGHTPAIPEAERHTIDSLAITKPAFDSTQHARAKAETVYVTRATHTVAVAEATARTTDSLRRVAIVSEARAEAEGDTASLWRTAARDWHTTADSAIASRDSLRHAVGDLRLALDLRGVELTDEHKRRVAGDELALRLAKEFRHAGECRVLFLTCPSRTRVAVVTAGVTAVAVVITRNAIHR